MQCHRQFLFRTICDSQMVLDKVFQKLFVTLKWFQMECFQKPSVTLRWFQTQILEIVCDCLIVLDGVYKKSSAFQVKIHRRVSLKVICICEFQTYFCKNRLCAPNPHELQFFSHVDILQSQNFMKHMQLIPHSTKI